MKAEPLFWGKTFDDFLFYPQYSQVGPGEEISSRSAINLTMPLTSKIKINMPIVGANMDTVTGERMMRALSLEGAFGFLDRHCSIAEQARRVKYVKTRHSSVIEHPAILHRQTTILDAKNFMRKNEVSGILVEEEPESGMLAGVLSNRDMPSDSGSDSKPISEFMTPLKKLVTGGPNITADEAEKLMFGKRIEKLPIIDGKGKVKGLITMKDLRLTKQRPYSSKDKRGRLLVGAAIGATGDYMERAAELVKNGADCILVDIAHYHSISGKKALETFRKKFESIDLVCGNIASAAAAHFIKELDLGVGALKVGIGPGRGCRTRLETAAGVPQLQAIREIFVATGGQIPIIADGGVKNDKDIFLALICGASTVMLGSKLAGTDESPGTVIEDPVTKLKYKRYRGMTSPEAVMDSHSTEELDDRLGTPAEGQSDRVPYVGSVVGILGRIRGHIQSAVSYAGETNLADAYRKMSQEPGKFLIPLSEAAKVESFQR